MQIKERNEKAIRQAAVHFPDRKARAKHEPLEHRPFDTRGSRDLNDKVCTFFVKPRTLKHVHLKRKRNEISLVISSIGILNGQVFFIVLLVAGIYNCRHGRGWIQLCNSTID